MKKNYRLVNKNDSPPAFFNRVTDALAKSWNSLGSIACKINEVSDGYFEIMFFPASREVYGGRDDGEVVFPGFHLNVGRFVRVFDKEPSPKVTFDSLRKNYIPHLLFRGHIEGNLVKIAIMESPPSGQTAVERVYTSGPKKGQVEAIK